jgi:hypothetical protein
MAGIVWTAVSMPSLARPAAAELLPLREPRWACVAVASSVIAGACFCGGLSHRESSAAFIALATANSLLSAGHFGGAPTLAGRRLRSPDFCLLYVKILWVVVWIFHEGGTAMRAACAADPRCRAQLTPSANPLFSWLAASGGGVDLSDGQWSFFRQQLRLLGAAAAGFLLLSRAARLCGRIALLCVYCAAGMGFLLLVHGVGGALFFCAFAALNYGVALASSSWATGVTAPPVITPPRSGLCLFRLALSAFLMGCSLGVAAADGDNRARKIWERREFSVCSHGSFRVMP